ncbi:hypothetical protein Daci_1919 [Delftia acidovorans SPH-1]|uniref:Uncharacterized protein n=1 Tax=Delftia acidovorans (strain DSM 14801 / SPH-1) TaxID=398578 RepID=A9BYL6_DELAS|nr:hypothetical protein [Delftia acidovorans]ABX34559.1 hypothetical protein Daci_1919 [Delftia acidovorans SPH-1]QPS76076.1 hypothetical protein I6G48_05840 [Delftia acidovorans]
MKKEHPHAKVLRWIADGETVQVQFAKDWHDLSLEGLLRHIAEPRGDYPFRLKPKTILVGDREIEAPVMSGPGYYITDHGDAFRWFGEATLDPGANLQKLGRIYATEEAARAAQEAITALLTREPS